MISARNAPIEYAKILILPVCGIISCSPFLMPEINLQMSTVVWYPDLKNRIGSSVRRLLRAIFAKLDISIFPIEEFLSFIKFTIARGSFHDDGDLFMWNEIGKRITSVSYTHLRAHE